MVECSFLRCLLHAGLPHYVIGGFTYKVSSWSSQLIGVVSVIVVVRVLPFLSPTKNIPYRTL